MEIAIVGGGTGGLLTAALLAGDGHDVAVFERDPAEPPSPGEAWEHWERRGVNQFRLPHFLLPAFRQLSKTELPGLVEALEAHGAHTFDMLAGITGGRMADAAFTSTTARRPVLEAAVAAWVAEQAGIEIHRGRGIAGLVGAPERDGTPHVKGVSTEDGEKVGADLVVLAGGRRCPVSGWLADLGAGRIDEEQEDSGFVYYGRHIRSEDGAPFVPAPVSVPYGSISLLALPCDHGTAGVGIVATSRDTALRPLRDPKVWDSVVRRLPVGDTIVGAEPISDHVFMGGLEDRWCRLCPGGIPAVTGAVVVADAFSATNPSLGRGITLALRSSVALRDAIRGSGEHPRRLVEEYDKRLESELTPWYRSTVWNDRNRLEDCHAAIEDRASAADDSWGDLRKLNALPAVDPSVIPRLLRSRALLVERPEEMLADPAIQAQLESFQPPPQSEVLSRAELLSLVAS